MNDALTLQGVTKSFGAHVAVNDLSLVIPTGSVYGFLGMNGAGKTTTIRMIMSIFYPDSGTIRVLGNDSAEAVRTRLGYLPEERGLYKKMRVGEIVAYFGRLKGLPGAEAKRRARALIERYGLADWHDKKCDSLSKGMSQKIQILGTLIHEPELVILDEPFSGLDPVNQDVLRTMIRDMKDQGRTVIFSTHVMEHAEQLCDYVFLIHHGRKMIDGRIEDVKRTGDLAIKLDYVGDAAVVQGLKGVQRINDFGNSAEIFPEPGADPQDILRQLVGRVSIRRFDLREPSLHEIFLRTVGTETAS